MSAIAVATSPLEEEALFNPAFLALIVHAAAADYAARSQGRAFPHRWHTQ
jgi:hypothetical protein